MRRALLALLAAALVLTIVSTADVDAAGPVVKVATYNAPHRYGDGPRESDLRRLVERGVTVVALQEVTDNDPARIKPNGWGHYRPTAARSAAVIWDRSLWTRVKAGHFRIDLPGQGTEPRYLVWVHLRHKPSGKVMRFASAHLAAWPYKTDARAREHAHEVRLLARWIDSGRNRVIGCDCNSGPRHERMAPLRRTADHHVQVLGTYKGRAPLDHLWRNDTRPRVFHASTMRTRGSDHWVLIGKVRL